MRAGRLRHRITIEEPLEARNSVGEAVKTWSPVKTIWAAIEPLRGEEKFSVDQAQANVDTKITARSIAVRDVTTKMRLVHRERVFDIDANIEWQSRGIFSEIYCKEAA